MLTKDTTMSFSQFGYPYNATSQFFVSANPSPTTCCDSLSRSVSDGSAGPQTPAASASSASSFCCGGGGSSCGERRLSGGGGGRAELSAALGMYSSPYAAAAAAAAASQSYANYFPYGAEPSSALYSTLNPQYDIKDGTGALHSGITQTAAYYPYDHSLGQYQYDRYGTVDFNSTARRKNATRETTSTLKTWLYEHRKNPYPTKGEKIMLAIITKMTLTQVSTWFANARRRLKKENKMTWSPKNKGGEDRKDDLEKGDLDCVTKDSSDCKEKDLHLSDLDDMEDEDCDKGLDSDCEKGPSEEEQQQQQHQGLHRAMAVSGAPLAKRDCGSELHLSVHNGFHPFPCGIKSLTSLPGLPSDFLDSVALKPLSTSSITTTSSSSLSSPSSCGPPAGALSLSHYEALDKPRIWSLARTAASGLALSPHPGLEVRTAGDCQLPGSRIPPPPLPPPVVAPTVACRVAAAGLHTSSHAENPFQEGPPSHPKIYGAGAGYGHKGLQMHCSSFPALQDACQFASIEGFAGVKAETESPGLSRACGGGLQEDKVTAFRPVMKR